MTPLRVTLLGEARLELEGTRLSLPAKAAALFCYLAVRWRSHSREELLDLLWGDTVGGDPAANLRVALSKLRKPLGPYLDIEREYVALRESATLCLDTQEFEEAVAASSYEQADALYHGDFMAGFALPDAPRFEEWVITERERLRRLARECHLELSERKSRSGDHAGALDQALRLLALEPWHEAAQRRVMRLQARQGKFEAALQQYEACRALLKRELGLEPSAATGRLRDRILSARDRPPSRLPLPDNALVGRRAELATLCTLLARDECRLVTILGTGGVGKTRLAIELARRLEREFLEGIHFIPLTAAVDRYALIETLLAELGIEQGGKLNPEELLLEALAASETLLLLDNFEQLVDTGSDLLVKLLEDSPHLRIVVTSRSRLNLKREWLFDLEGLEFPAGTTGSRPAGSSESELLFARTAERLGARKGDSDTEGPAIAEICRLVEGHPLAIELAAASRRRLSATRIAESVARGIDALSSDARDVPERQRSVRAVFDHSWRLLAIEERSALERLALCAGGFTSNAGRELAEAGDALLESLIGKSLLRRSEQDRFDIHPLVREYALAKLGERPEELRSALRRHAEYYLERVRDALIRRWDEDQAHWSGLLRREQENVRASLEWALQNDPLFGLGLARRLWRYWRQWGQLREGRRWLEAMLQAAPAHEHLELRSEAVNGLASLAFLQGDSGAAREYYRESLELYRRLNDEQGVAMILNNLANVVRRDGDLDVAEEHYRESLEIRERLGDEQGVASTLSNLGLTAERRGDLESAHDLYLRSLELRRNVNDLEGVAIALCNLGCVTSKRGEFGEARAWFQRSIAQERQIGVRSLLDDSLAGLAEVEAALSCPERAALLLGAAEALREETGKAVGPAEAEEFEATMSRLREVLGPGELAERLRSGRELPLEQAVDVALGKVE